MINNLGRSDLLVYRICRRLATQPHGSDGLGADRGTGWRPGPGRHPVSRGAAGPGSARLGVEREPAVEQLPQREVVLADVLDRVAPGAGLPADQAAVVVVGVEGAGDAAHVVDLGSVGERAPDHGPLHGA